MSPMEPALSFVETCPSSRAGVLAILDSLGARHASDAGVAIVKHWVVRDLMLVEIRPDILDAPFDQRVDLDNPEADVRVDKLRARPLGCLVSTDTGDPSQCVLENATKGLNLA